MKTEKRTTTINMADLLIEAVRQPGRILEAYQNFHNYSIGNMMAAAFQAEAKGLPLGPIATFKRWQELGRTVKKGEKALFLCQPTTLKVKDAATNEEKIITRFQWSAKWFLLAQTEGPALDAALTHPEFDRTLALKTLDIELVPFTYHDGNAQGYAQGRQVALNPVAQFPLKTLFHEIGHVVLGHTAEGPLEESDKTPVNIREVEAEAVALICLEALGLPGQEYARGYIQTWLKDQIISEKSAHKIFKAADTILKAGLESTQQLHLVAA